MATKKYTDEEVELALQMTAVFMGDTRAAAAALKTADNPVDVPRGTICSWIEKTHVERYVKIRDERQSDTQSRMAVRAEDVVSKSLKVQAEMLERIDVSKMKPEDLPKALREVATPGGIAADKTQMFRERPFPGMPATRTVEELVKALVALKVAEVVPFEHPTLELGAGDVVEVASAA